MQLYRPDWATVIERRQEKGDPQVMDEILTKHKPIASRIRHLIDALQPQGVVRKRGFEEGEDVITSYSIHYTKLYDGCRSPPRAPRRSPAAAAPSRRCRDPPVV